MDSAGASAAVRGLQGEQREARPGSARSGEGALSEQIAGADAELKELAAEDVCMRRLMTVPGVGPVTAVRSVAALDQSSGSRTSRVSRCIWDSFRVKTPPGFAIKQERLTRAGAPQVRWALGQAAWSLYLRRPEDPMVRWARRIAHAIASVRSTTCRARETLEAGGWVQFDQTETPAQRVDDHRTPGSGRVFCDCVALLVAGSRHAPENHLRQLMMLGVHRLH